MVGLAWKERESPEQNISRYAKGIQMNQPFRDIPYMGVINVVNEAAKLGFYNGNPDWSNLGQGQPEIGDIEGAPTRFDEFAVKPIDHAYGHINGMQELREAIAAHYNRLYRVGKTSKYTADNVSVASGGRLMLSRVFASLGKINLGYQIPDYTAYQEQLEYHEYRFKPVLMVAEMENDFRISPAQLERAINRQGLGAFVASNPCNPTGQVMAGAELKGWVDISRETQCVLVLDEFYSHFIYQPDGAPAGGPVSAAAYVEDVNADPVVLIDGLTKNYRYPGWRLGWTIGPKDVIETIGRAASAIDGGPSNPVQRAAIQVLEEGRADQETAALRQVFSQKRNLMLSELQAMGIKCPIGSNSTFYVWASLEGLPEPFNDANYFFREALKNRVMTVPGPSFDVNPGGRRTKPSPYAQWMRFSFGPSKDNVVAGLGRLREMLQKA